MPLVLSREYLVVSLLSKHLTALFIQMTDRTKSYHKLFDTQKILLIFSCARGVNFSPILHLHLYFVYASIEGSGEPVHNAQTHLSLRCSTINASTEYQNHTCWPI